MLALTLETAKNAAIVAIVVFVALAIAAAWLMQTMVQKLVGVVVLALLALLVWTQRDALQDCADRVRADLASGQATDTTCSFLGQDVTIEPPRS